MIWFLYLLNKNCLSQKRDRTVIFNFEVGLYRLKLICSREELMADLNRLKAITKMQETIRRPLSLSSSSFETVAHSLQGKEWRQDKISIFNIAFSFSAISTGSDEIIIFVVVVSFTSSSGSDQKILDLMEMVTLRNVFFELIWANFSSRFFNQFYSITEDFFFWFPFL